MVFVYRFAQCSHHGDGEHEHPDDDVGGVETDERIKGRAEEVGFDRQVVVDDQVIPFFRGVAEKDEGEQDRSGEPSGAG